MCSVFVVVSLRSSVALLLFRWCLFVSLFLLFRCVVALSLCSFLCFMLCVLVCFFAFLFGSLRCGLFRSSDLFLAVSLLVFACRCSLAWFVCLICCLFGWFGSCFLFLLCFW